MIKKICIALMAFVFVQMVVAQSMSDDQVVKYVMEQKEKGLDQQTIAEQLVRRGVTPQQLQRIKRKYEAQQQQLGAQDLVGGKVQDRSRTITVGVGQVQEDDVKSGNKQMNDALGFMDIDSLAYYQDQLMDIKQQVFGRNIFNNKMLTFEPALNVPTPSDYRLGAGDQVIIDVWGASQTTFNGNISPDGTVTLEGVGPVSLAGMTVAEANKNLKRQLGQYYADSDINLTVGQIRSIQVQVMGEVVTPGTYTLSALSSAFNALYAAGGVNEIGTLRDIKVYRRGKIISTIDVYDYILNGNIAGDVRLADNDVIVVGPYDCLVNIDGKVKRPMYYEMKESESVGRLLDYAGGFTGDAFRDNVRLVRKSGREHTIHTVGEFEMNGFHLKDGDSLYVDSVIPRFSNMAEVRGAVFHPGMFQMDGNIQTVRQLIKAADGLREDAFVTRAVMHRQKDDLTIEMLPVDVKGIMEGTVADVPLRKNDVLFIPSMTEMRGERTFAISGEVNYPGKYHYADKTSIEDLILQAGGLTDAASHAKVDVYRRIIDVNAVTDNEKMAETYTFNLRDGFVIGEKEEFFLQPYDEVVVRRSPMYEAQRKVTVAGAVNFTGEYVMLHTGYRLTDLLRDAGGLTTMAYVKGARLRRNYTEEELNQRAIQQEESQIELYENSLKTGSDFDMERAKALMDMKQDKEKTYIVAIDLEKAMEKPGSIADVLLREGDVLDIPQFSSMIKISGEVQNPISVGYVEGKSLKYYINKAGGYSDNARKKKTYAIYMNGSTDELGRRAKRGIQPGCEIVVPARPQKERMSSSEILTIGTSTASIATMVATLVTLFK